MRTIWRGGRRRIVSLAFVWMFLVAAGPIWAESLSGHVLDPDGKRVAGATLRLFDRRSAEVRAATSSREGDYSFDGLPAGEYVLQGEGAGAMLSGAESVFLEGAINLDLRLKLTGQSASVLVTASSTPLSIEEIGKASDVVTASEIAERVDLFVGDAVRNLPGVRVKQLGGPGGFSTIRIRGMRDQDTAVLIDGMRFRDAAGLAGDATAFIEDLSVVDVERVELLRGSGSSIYGSNALGGVLNIISRPAGGAFRTDFRAEGGGLGLVRGVMSFGGGLDQDRFGYSGAISHLNVTEGARDGLGYHNTGVQGSARYSIRPGISVTGRLWYSGARVASVETPTFTSSMGTGYPSGSPIPAIALAADQLTHFERGEAFTAGNATFIPEQIDPDGHRSGTFLNGALTYQQEISRETSYRVSYQRVSTKRAYIDGPAGPGAFEPAAGSRSNYNGYVDTVAARLDQRLGGRHLATFGYEFEAEQYRGFDGLNYSGSAASNAIELRQRSNSFYAQDQIRFIDGRLQFTLAARAQTFSLENPTFAGYTNPYAGTTVATPPNAYTGDGSVVYLFARSRTKLRAHAGNSFRAPSAYERFGGGGGSYYGDPRLSPDRSVAFDGGVDQWIFGSRARVSATVYYTNLQQTVRFDSSFPTGVDPFNRVYGGYANGGGGIARGVELSGQWAARTTTLGLSYTFTNSDSRTPTIAFLDYHQAIGLSAHAFSVNATQRILPRLSVAFDLTAQSDYVKTLSGLDFSTRAYVFDGPIKADVVVRYQAPVRGDRPLELYVKVNNLFNRSFFEDGFSAPRAWAIAGMRFQY